MEDTLQRVFSILLSVMIFFLLPLYMAFEKKDDISYSLALKITSNFVDEVCNKGYMTIDMYNDFVSDLSVTGNTYDISLEHVARVYNPVIYAYKDNNQYSFDYNLYKKNYDSNGSLNVNGVSYTNATLSYRVSDLRYSTEQILRIMDQDAISNSSSIIHLIDYTYDENSKKYIYGDLSGLISYKNLNINQISPVSGLYRTTDGKTVYPMNKGDKLTVTIKNTNITIASMLFNTLTFGARSGADTKVYINYGGTIENEQYRENVIDTTVTENATDLKSECDLKGHDYIKTELKDCSENIKIAFDFNNIVPICSGFASNTMAYTTSATVGQIVYFANKSQASAFSTNAGYYMIDSLYQNGNVKYYILSSLGPSYKINVCSRCGDYKR